MYEIFKEIESESSVNKKIEIIKRYESNDVFKKILYLIYSPKIKFFIKKIPTYNIAEYGDNITLDTLKKLSTIYNRELTGNAAIEYLKTDILEKLTPEDAYIVERIIEKKANLGAIAATNLNKAFGKDFIETTPYQGAIAFDEKKANELFSKATKVVSQIKMDGRYANVLKFNEEDLLIESRSGEENILTGALGELYNLPNGIVLNGELTIDGYNRYSSNGIIQSIITIHKKGLHTEDVSKLEKEIGMSLDEINKKIRYTVWDCITLEEYSNKKSNRKYSDRFDYLKSIIKDYKQISIVDSKEVSTLDEAKRDFKEKISNDLEGTIIKSLDGLWKDGKPTYQMKMKLDFSVDLKLVGFTYGAKNTKNENKISSLIVESSCGKLKTKAAGLKDNVIDEITKNPIKYFGSNISQMNRIEDSFYINESIEPMIVEVRSCGISLVDDNDFAALLHPSFIEFRYDKKTSDSFDDIKMIENSKKNI